MQHWWECEAKNARQGNGVPGLQLHEAEKVIIQQQEVVVSLPRAPQIHLAASVGEERGGALRCGGAGCALPWITEMPLPQTMPRLPRTGLRRHHLGPAGHR